MRAAEVFSLQAKLQSRPDLLLLVSLLLAILLTPALDHGRWSRLVLAAVTFIPVVISIVRLSQVKGWVWPSALLALGNVIFVVAGNMFGSRVLTGIRWGFLAAFFALTAAGLFSYLRNSRTVTQAQLYTAINIYLLLGLVWASLYLAMDAFSPGSIQVGNHAADRQTELLYFMPDNALDDWLRRYSAAGWGGPYTGGTGGGNRGSLHSDYRGALSKQIQKRTFGLVCANSRCRKSPPRLANFRIVGLSLKTPAGSSTVAPGHNILRSVTCFIRKTYSKAPHDIKTDGAS